MVAYCVESDKNFLRCKDTETVEVYELDGLYSVPFKGKHWTRLAVSVGPSGSHDSLKIGEAEIKGRDLQRLMKDLYELRLIVNREGLCFLAAAAGITAMTQEEEYKSSYYRMFDLFDWSKYGAVKTSVNTKWDRRDIVEGRPMAATRDGEWKENKMDLEKKLDDMEFMLLSCSTGQISDIYFKILEDYCKRLLPASKWKFDPLGEQTKRQLTLSEPNAMRLLTPLKLKVPSLMSITPPSLPNIPGKHVDSERWYYIQVMAEPKFSADGDGSVQSRYNACGLIYYDGLYEWVTDAGYSSLRLPTERDNIGIFDYYTFDIYHIRGVGTKLGCLLE